MVNSQSPENSVSDEASDGELFEMMVAGGESEFDALEVFYHRYAKILQTRICRIKGLPEGDNEDMVHETMMQAFRSANTFKPPEPSLSNAAKQRSVLVWLIRIARNIHFKDLRKLKLEGVQGFDSIDVENEDGKFSHYITDKLKDGEGYHKMREAEEKAISSLSANEQNESVRMQILKDRLEQLPEKKRKILLAYFGDEYDHRNPTRPLPRAKIAELKEQHGESSANLRQIKKRTLEDVSTECLKIERTKRKED